MAPGSRLMRPGSDGSFSAIEVVDQTGFASGEKGSGKVCSTIQTSGSRIAGENRFSNCAVDASSVSAPFAAVASMMAATIATACCAKAPLAIAKIGVAASNMVRREEAIDKMGNFEQDWDRGRDGSHRDEGNRPRLSHKRTRDANARPPITSRRLSVSARTLAPNVRKFPSPADLLGRTVLRQVTESRRQSADRHRSADRGRLGRNFDRKLGCALPVAGCKLRCVRGQQ